MANDAIEHGYYPVYIKKLFVFGALEMESSMNRSNPNKKSSDKNRQNWWRGALAYHLYLSSLRQFYDGSFKAALKSVISKEMFNLFFFFSFFFGIDTDWIFNNNHLIF